MEKNGEGMTRWLSGWERSLCKLENLNLNPSDHVKSQVWLAPPLLWSRDSRRGHYLTSQPSPDVGFWFWEIALRHIRQRAKGESIACPVASSRTGTHTCIYMYNAAALPPPHHTHIIHHIQNFLGWHSVHTPQKP